MTVEAQETTTLHGGRLVARRLKAYGVSKLFTLSGGHLFSIYDGCRAEGIDIVDVRHEASATFAAEGWAKVTREPGVAALTAGPGVTNGMSAIASAQQNHSPVLVLGGRAPAMRWGQGSLQEIDHVPFVRPLVKLAATAGATAEIPGLIDDAWGVMRRDHPGPGVPRLPARRRVHGGRGARRRPRTGRPAAPRADAAAVDRAVALLRDADRPVIMAGTNLYWGHGEDALRELAEAAGVPGVPQRPGARLPARRPPELLLPRAERRAEGRRRRARDRRADGLPARLRRRVRRGDRDRGDRPRRARARAPARRWRPSATATSPRRWAR